MKLLMTELLLTYKIPLDLDDYKVHIATDGALEAFLSGSFKTWQEDQDRNNFPKKFIVSLLGLKAKHHWLYAGVYRVLSDVES